MSTPPPSRQQRIAVARQRASTGQGWLRSRFAGAGLVRPRRGALAAGVLAGLARRLNVSPGLLRVAFLVSMLLPGPQILLYIAFWIAMPREP